MRNCKATRPSCELTIKGIVLTLLISAFATSVSADSPSLDEPERRLSLFRILTGMSVIVESENKINLHDLIERTASRNNLDSATLASIVILESAGDPCALSPKGAKGLGQIMDGTADYLGIKDVFDPRQNLDGTSRYFVEQLSSARGNLQLAAAAYNYGPRAISTSHTNLPAETKMYIENFAHYIDTFSDVSWKGYLPKDIPVSDRKYCRI